jgi:hypothetical protein
MVAVLVEADERDCVSDVTIGVVGQMSVRQIWPRCRDHVRRGLLKTATISRSVSGLHRISGHLGMIVFITPQFHGRIGCLDARLNWEQLVHARKQIPITLETVFLN